MTRYLNYGLQNKLIQEEIILLDFQDLGFGPIGIDLAGILIDHYYETNLELVSLYSNKFAQLSKFDLSGDEVYEYALWGALQRNLRIMGTLTSLYIHKNKKFRIMDLPRIISNSAIVANEIGESELFNFLLTFLYAACKKILHI